MEPRSTVDSSLSCTPQNIYSHQDSYYLQHPILQTHKRLLGVRISRSCKIVLVVWPSVVLGHGFLKIHLIFLQAHTADLSFSLPCFSILRPLFAHSTFTRQASRGAISILLPTFLSFVATKFGTNRFRQNPRNARANQAGDTCGIIPSSIFPSNQEDDARSRLSAAV